MFAFGDADELDVFLVGGWAMLLNVSVRSEREEEVMPHLMVLTRFVPLR